MKQREALGAPANEDVNTLLSRAARVLRHQAPHIPPQDLLAPLATPATPATPGVGVAVTPGGAAD
jgi:hypothetical protein